MQDPDGNRALKKRGLADAQPQARAAPAARPEPQIETLRANGAWAVGAEGGVPAKEGYIRVVEAGYLARAHVERSLVAAITRADNADQNQFNKIGDKGGAGDAKLRMYMDILKETMLRAYRRACGNPYLLRDSALSDETLLSAAGNDLALMKRLTDGFGDAHTGVKKEFLQSRLDSYEYDAKKIIVLENGREGIEFIPMSLRKLSCAMKDDSRIVNCHVGVPILVPLAGAGFGFIGKAIKEIEKEELWFASGLPDGFRPVFRDLPRIAGQRIPLQEAGMLEKGEVAIEIKFSHLLESDRRAPLDFLYITLKGVAETLAERFGLRYINTYMGKEIADKFLKIAHLAMQALREAGFDVRRTDSNFIFVISGQPGEILRRATEAVSKEMKAAGECLPFEPSLVGVDASGMHTNDLRAMLALAGLGLGSGSTRTLTYADMLVSTTNLLKEEVVDEAVERMDFNDDSGKDVAWLAIRAVRETCAAGGIRDAEDLAYMLRSSGRADAAPLEKSVWEFAERYGIEFRNRLIEVIYGL